MFQPITMTITDNGGPGVSQGMWQLMGYPPLTIEHGNFQVWVSEEYVP